MARIGGCCRNLPRFGVQVFPDLGRLAEEYLYKRVGRSTRQDEIPASLLAMLIRVNQLGIPEILRGRLATMRLERNAGTC